jgi:hypothetical protein
MEILVEWLEEIEPGWSLTLPEMRGQLNGYQFKSQVKIYGVVISSLRPAFLIDF